MFGKSKRTTRGLIDVVAPAKKKNPGLGGAMIDFVIPPKKRSSKKRKVAKGALGLGALGAIGATIAEKRSKRPLK